MCTVAEFRTRFPEFSSGTEYPDGRIQLFLDDAALCISEPVYDTMYGIAVCYLAAHELYLGTRTATSSGSVQDLGPTVSKTAGQVSKSKGVASLDLTDGDSYYLQTLYGQKYLNIRDKVKVPGFLAINKVRFT